MTWLYSRLREFILPLSEIGKNLPNDGTIIDFGCGQGIITAFLAQTKSRRVIGVDANAKRLQKSARKNLIFINGDITKFKIPKLHGAVISDVLHHIDYKNQKNLLSRIYTSLEKNGILVIKEIDSGEQVRSRLSRFWDFVLYPKDKISYNDSQNLKSYLEKLGFIVTIKRTNRLFPGSTTLFLCKK